MKIDVIALRDFYYDGKDIKQGPAKIDEKDLEILLLAQAVKRKEPKRTYKTRDMTAEDHAS